MLIGFSRDLCAAMAKDLRGGFQVRTFTKYPGSECMPEIIRPEPPGYSRLFFAAAKLLFIDLIGFPLY